jgi:hypothetical protein
LIRAFYRTLLWLHPAAFEERFAEEMLWIFDLNVRAEPRRGTSLLIDCCISLFRQWLLRTGIWKFGVGLLVNATLIVCSVVLPRQPDCRANDAPVALHANHAQQSLAAPFSAQIVRGR